MKKVLRDMSTAENREFWAPAPRSAEIAEWPAWKRSGINVADRRIEPSLPPLDASSSDGDDD